MRHRCQRRSSFGLKPGPRLALIRNLVSSLVQHERIKTTRAKALEVRRHIEKAITMGKNGTLSSRRVLLSRWPHVDTVSKIIDILSIRFKERNGGYTRIIKLGQRAGDSAEMAYLEFVDYDPVQKKESEKIPVKKTEKKSEEELKKPSKTLTKKSKKDPMLLKGKEIFKLSKKRKKHLRKIKSYSRRINRNI